MKRRRLIEAGGLGAVLATGVAPAVHAQQTVRWRLASSFPRTLGLFEAADVFAKQVRLLSNGRFEISVHPAGELVPPFGVVDAVQSGTIEITHTAPYYFFGKDDVFALGCAIPFGLNSRQMTAWMTEGNGRNLMREFYAGYGLVNYSGGNTGAQMGGWYRKEVKSVADLRGMKIRIGGFAGKVMARLKSVPQNIPAGEIYAALEKGTIDAAELVGPYDDQRTGLSKVAPYYYHPGWWEGCAHLEFFVGTKALATLSNDNRAILDAASAIAHTHVQAKYDINNPIALRQVVSSGAKLRAFPEDVMNLAFKEATALYEDLGKTNPAWKKIYADYAKFRGEQNLWFRFAEAEFDRFMQRQKLL